MMKKSIQGMKMVKQTFEPDLVHLHMSAFISFYHLKTLHAYPSPTLLTLHNCFGEFDVGLGTVLGQTLRAADWTTMVSNAVKADAVKIYPEISDRSSVIYNGIDDPQVSYSPLDFNVPRILGLGRLIRRKGFDILIDAFSLVQDRFPQVRLVIAGDGYDRNDLIEHAATLDLKNQVDFIGTVTHEEVFTLINTATMVVIPSRGNEAFSLVALEAAQMGRPVVATKRGGLAETVKHQKTGLLVDHEDSQGLADAIIFFLENPDIANQMGQAGRLQVQTTFSWERFINAYEGLYRSMATSS